MVIILGCEDYLGSLFPPSDVSVRSFLCPSSYFNKIRDTKGTLHAKMGTIKDRNGMDLTEAEDIKKKWQEYTEKLYKKDLHDQIITML